MKKLLVLVLLFVSLSATMAFAQECFSCKQNDEWLGSITKIEVSSWDNQKKATAVDIFLSLRPGWNGKDDNGCCTVWKNVITQSCVQFGVDGIYFGSDVTGYGWDANHDRVTDENEWMPYSSTYWAEWETRPDYDNMYIIIHGIPLKNGLLKGNIFIVTSHGEIIYFIPSELKRCDDYARSDELGAGEIYINFWQ